MKIEASYAYLIQLKTMQKPAILFTFLLVLCSISTYAQTTKGTILLGGSLHFNTSTNRFSGGNTYESESTNGRISPNIGYFITDKLALGLNPGFQFDNNTSIQSPVQTAESNRRNFSVGPFVRYYQTLSDRVSVFGQASLGFSFGKTTTENVFRSTPTTTVSNNFGINLGINPGIVFFATRRLGFEAHFGNLSYNYDSSTTENSENRNTSLSLSLNLSSLGLGIHYYLGR